ncbi:hypothetical protein K438DRAFT_1967214 [Mycena galopus ATCC 62051]|nr:hypothetical protein K438DRAFT_1967214 [Mycena galopus ATCC 62051]
MSLRLDFPFLFSSPHRVHTCAHRTKASPRASSSAVDVPTTAPLYHIHLRAGLPHAPPRSRPSTKNHAPFSSSKKATRAPGLVLGLVLVSAHASPRLLHTHAPAPLFLPPLPTPTPPHSKTVRSRQETKMWGGGGAHLHRTLILIFEWTPASVSLKKAEKRKTKRKGGERKAQHRALATDTPLRRRSHRITPLIAPPSSARSRSGRHLSLSLSLLRTPSLLRAIHHPRLDSTLGTHEVPPQQQCRAGRPDYSAALARATDSRGPRLPLAPVQPQQLLARTTAHDHPFSARVRTPESRAYLVPALAARKAPTVAAGDVCGDKNARALIGRTLKLQMKCQGTHRSDDEADVHPPSCTLNFPAARLKLDHFPLTLPPPSPSNHPVCIVARTARPANSKAKTQKEGWRDEGVPPPPAQRDATSARRRTRNRPGAQPSSHQHGQTHCSPRFTLTPPHSDSTRTLPRTDPERLHPRPHSLLARQTRATPPHAHPPSSTLTPSYVSAQHRLDTTRALTPAPCAMLVDVAPGRGPPPATASLAPRPNAHELRRRQHAKGTLAARPRPPALFSVLPLFRPHPQHPHPHRQYRLANRCGPAALARASILEPQSKRAARQWSTYSEKSVCEWSRRVGAVRSTEFQGEERRVPDGRLDSASSSPRMGTERRQVGSITSYAPNASVMALSSFAIGHPRVQYHPELNGKQSRRPTLPHALVGHTTCRAGQSHSQDGDE